MATIQERNGSFRILFVYRGKRHTFTLGVVERDEAENKARQVEYLLMRLKQGLKQLPDGVDIVTYLTHDGEPPAQVLDLAPQAPDASKPVTFGHLRDAYLATHGNGTIEASTLALRRIHLGHLVGYFKEESLPAETTLGTLQGYVNQRARQKVAAATIRLEVGTLRAVWNWGVPMGLTTGVFPGKGLRYPKDDEKPPFMTRAEIDRHLAAGGDAEALWECLYLTAAEVAQLLEHVRSHAGQPWLYPLFAFAAHTGARRSEILRVLVADVDLAADVVTIREKKRSRGRRTTRRVPLTALLKQVLTDWLANHPGGPLLFCQSGTVARSRKRSATTGHRGQKTRARTAAGRKATVRQRAATATAGLTRNEVHDHFKRVLKGSEWQHVRGLHVLRHSFISACASKAVDQRLIDEWVGHSTEEQRRRYRHLYPSTQQAALGKVFE